MKYASLDPFDLEDLVRAMEPMIRRVVREEIARAAGKQTKVFELSPDSPLYADLLEIRRRKAKGKIKLRSHEEVWSE